MTTRIHPAGYTTRQAAELTGVHPDTIKRDRSEGRYPNATKVEHAWRIPLADLIAAGRADASLAGTGEADALAGRRAVDELAELREQVLRETARREHLEQLVAELRGDKAQLARTNERLLAIVGGA